MIKCAQRGLEWLEFELLSSFKSLKHASFLRKKGYSRDPFDSLNFSVFLGDDPQSVAYNYSIAKQVLNIPLITCMQQVHGTCLKLIKNKPSEAYITQCDGLMTQAKGLGILVTHADCQAALFYDPVQQAIAAVHAGWRGQAQNIYALCIDQMYQAFGSLPQDLRVCISPSLGPEYAEFKKYQKELPKDFWRFKDKKNRFDLWQIASDQLLRKGILKEHMQIAQLCTYAQKEDFFSYRREKQTGRMGSVICLA